MANVGMIQSRDRPGFLLETIGEILVRDFDRYVAAETRVAGAINLAHSTGADQRKDFVGSQTSPGGKPHGVRIILLHRVLT